MKIPPKKVIEIKPATEANDFNPVPPQPAGTGRVARLLSLGQQDEIYRRLALHDHHIRRVAKEHGITERQAVHILIQRLSDRAAEAARHAYRRGKMAAFPLKKAA